METIAANVGYENVEHVNRLFKKAYDMTPVQYRKQSADYSTPWNCAMHIRRRTASTSCTAVAV